MWIIYIMVGAFFGFLLAAVLGRGKISDLSSENARLYMDNAELKEGLIRGNMEYRREKWFQVMSNPLDEVNE